MIKNVSPNREFLPYPLYRDRAAWEAAPKELCRKYVALGEECKGTVWQSMPASWYMDFQRNGNRTRYETLYFSRRKTLFNLMLAECFAGTGAFLDDIINGVWAICEETTWVVPAHNQHYPPDKSSAELYSVEDAPFIDLFAAETGSLLGWVYYFLGDEIAKQSKIAARRIALEVYRRILAPYLEHDDFFWMGFCHQDPVNNWNPWINSNVLAAFLIFGKTYPEMLLPGISKSIKSINRFLKDYHEDGGCDEGPGYFNVAGASVMDFIEELGCVSDVEELYQVPVIQNMAAFIYKVYIGGSYFVNYADASPRVCASLDLLARIGEKTGDENLVGIAAHLRKHGRKQKEIEHRSTLFRELGAIFYQAPVAEFYPPMRSWFPGIQVVTAREQAGSLDGMFFSAKGGHNNESHNHNDVGSFLLFYDSKPVLVDAGVETYTRFTFSDKRYDIWTMRSAYHNLPTINGMEQLAGEEHRAEQVVYNPLPGKTYFSAELKSAYPEESALQSYHRSFTFEHGAGLRVQDSYVLRQWKAPLVLNFLCYDPPVCTQEGILLGDKIRFEITGEHFTPQVEEIPLKDPRIYGDWERDVLYRLKLTATENKLESTVTMTFRHC